MLASDASQEEIVTAIKELEARLSSLMSEVAASPDSVLQRKILILELEVLRLVESRRNLAARTLGLLSTSGCLNQLMNYLASFLLRRWNRSFPARLKQIKTIDASNLFDASWYVDEYPDVAKSGFEPLRHYVMYGADEGRDPNPLFKTTWYLATYSDVSRQGVNPFAHYISIGAKRGYDPNPLFFAKWYEKQNSDVVGENPLLHYLRHGIEKGRNPNPFFDTAWYLCRRSDVAASYVNPLVHYAYIGAAEDCDPHPLFDSGWYRDQYFIDDVGEFSNPLVHYFVQGVMRGCKPNHLALDVTKEDGGAPGESNTIYDEKCRDDRSATSNLSPVDVLKWRLNLSGKKISQLHAAPTVGIFVHIFYVDTADEIASNLLNIPFNFRVYVSTDDEKKKAAIAVSFEKHGLGECTEIKLMSNLGWDLAPFLLGFSDEIRRHEIGLKIHGKRSRHQPSRYGNRWRAHLFSELLGDRDRAIYAVSTLATIPDLGILMAAHWQGVHSRIHTLGENYTAVQSILRRAGMSINPDDPIEFPSGSMFWFRREAIIPLLDLNLSWADFESCKIDDVDATIAHGLERCFLIFAAKAGLQWAFLPRRQQWFRCLPGAYM